MKIKNNLTKGIICILISGLGFSLMALFVKLSGDLPAMQKSFFRNFIVTIVAFFPFIKNFKKISYPKIKFDWFILFLRVFFGTVGIVCNFYAISHISLADSTVIQRLYPFIVLFLSFIFFKENISKLGILAILLSFSGVLFIIKPSFDNILSIGSIMALCGAFCSGAAYTALRRLGIKGISPEFIVFAFSIFSCISLIPFILINFVSMTFYQLILLILVGIFAAIGQFGITYAYKFAAAKSIAVFDYFQILFSGILGYIFFTEIPDVYSLFGYITIVLMGILLAYKKDK